MFGEDLQVSYSKTKAYIVIRIPQISNGVMDLNMTSGKRSLMHTYMISCDVGSRYSDSSGHLKTGFRFSGFYMYLH